MDADWEVEIGGQAPVIDGCWQGLVDLRHWPERAALLPEAGQLPSLADALVRLNSAASPVWTAKCDVWRPTDFDVDELDAQREEGVCAMACYIDLLPRSDEQWLSAGEAVADCEAIVARLHILPLRCCRTDLLVRQAYITPGREQLGITAYLTACGSTWDDARATLVSALEGFVRSVIALDPSPSAPAKLQ